MAEDRSDRSEKADRQIIRGGKSVMYFSKNDEKIVYVNHYSGLLEAEGKGQLCREDAEVWPAFDNKRTKEYDILSVKEGITGLGAGYLESFPNIDCLILSKTVESVDTTPALDKRMRKNGVLIRGEYDTFASRFPERLRDQLTANGMLRRFPEIANSRYSVKKHSR